MTTIAKIPLQRVIGVGWLLGSRRCPNRRPDALRRRIRQRMPSSGASRLYSRSSAGRTPQPAPDRHRVGLRELHNDTTNCISEIVVTARLTVD